MNEMKVKSIDFIQSGNVGIENENDASHKKV